MKKQQLKMQRNYKDTVFRMLFNNKEAAQNLLYFRYKTLDEARERAKALDCEGAFYPIATISDKLPAMTL